MLSVIVLFYLYKDTLYVRDLYMKLKNILLERSKNAKARTLVTQLLSGGYVLPRSENELLWRGMSYQPELPRDKTYSKIKIRTNRSPLDTNTGAHFFIEGARRAKYKNRPSRMKSVFATDDEDLAEFYGDPYVIIPSSDANIWAFKRDSYGFTSKISNMWTSYFVASFLQMNIENGKLPEFDILFKQNSDAYKVWLNMKPLIDTVILALEKQYYKLADKVADNYIDYVKNINNWYVEWKKIFDNVSPHLKNEDDWHYSTYDGILMFLEQASWGIENIERYFGEMEPYNPRNSYKEILIEGDHYIAMHPEFFERYIKSEIIL